MCCLAVALAEVGLMMRSPLIALYATRLGASASLAGGLFTAFALGRMAGQVPGGVLADRVGDRRVCAAALLISALGPLGFALVPRPYALLAFMAFEGVASGMVSPAFLSLVGRSVPGELRGRAIGVWLAVLLASDAVGPLVGAPAAAVWGGRLPFLLAAGLSASSAAVLRWGVLSPRPPAPASRESAAPDAAVANPAGWALLAGPGGALLMSVAAISFYGEFIFGMLQAMLPLYLCQVLGTGPAAVSLLFTVNFTILAALQPLAGYAADRVGGRRLLAVAPWLMVGAVAMMAFSRSYAGVVAWFCLECVGAAALIPTTRKVLSDYFSPRGQSGRAFGAFGLLSGLGAVVGPVATGLLYARWSAGPTFGVVAALGAVLALAYLAVQTSSARRPPVPEGS